MKKITFLLLFAMVCSFSFAQTFPGTGTPVDTQNGQTGISATCGTAFELNLTVDVTGVGVLGAALVLDQIDIDIAHTWSGDVVVTLIAPDGTTLIDVTSGNGGSGDNYVGTQFRDDATTPITAGAAPFTGVFNPEQALSTFNGVDADGTWTLNFCDSANGDIGTFNSWSINFAPPPPCANPTNLTGVVLTASTGELSWIASGTETLWDLEVVDITGGGSATGTPTVTGVTNPYLGMGLTEGNDYEAYVRADCGVDGTSDWVGPFAWSQNAPPNCAETPIFPADGAVDVPITLTLTWTAPTTGPAPTDYQGFFGVISGALIDQGNLGSTDTFADVNGLEYSTTYYWRLDPLNGASAATGCAEWSFTTEAVPAPPANDDFANATPVACGALNIMGDTTFATLDEAGAPVGSGADLDAPNVWYSYDTAVEGPGDVTVDLCPSLYDTSVLVYTGTSGNLTFVAGNDDSTQCGNTRSQVTFTAEGTTVYYITITGYNPFSTGVYDLSVSCVATTPPPANDLCANAEALALTVTTTGTTVGATQTGGEEQPTCDTFGSIADVWYSINIAAASDLSVVTTIAGTSDQANVAVYSACGGLQADQLACSDANGGESLTLPGLAAGTYYIRVWSDGSAPRPSAAGRIEGEFTITADATLSTNSFDSEGAFTFYPNPVKNTLTLNAQNIIEQVTMYNMLGQEVLRATPNTVDSDLDMSNLQTGTYFVKVTIGNVTKTIRVMKQ